MLNTLEYDIVFNVSKFMDLWFLWQSLYIIGDCRVGYIFAKFKANVFECNVLHTLRKVFLYSHN